MILQYPHLKHKILASFFGWFVQYPNVGHKICMFNEKNDDDKKIKIRKYKIIVINNRTRKRKRIKREKVKKLEKKLEKKKNPKGK
jgi:hypothetical protein